jgi:large subunit ribosomal protein L22
MEFKSEQKHLIISPRKVRPVVEVIKKMTPAKALESLPFIKKRASEYLIKVIKSAVANAGQKGADVQNLVFKEIQIGEGPRLKRGQPVSRGRWHPIKKRMSHIKVILMTKRTKVETEKPKKIAEPKAVEAKVKEVKAVKPVVKSSVKTVKKTVRKTTKNGTKS